MDRNQESDNQTVFALISLEHIYHYRCGSCDAWWSSADRHPRLGSSVHCPECGTKNLITALEIPSPVWDQTYANG